MKKLLKLLFAIINTIKRFTQDIFNIESTITEYTQEIITQNEKIIDNDSCLKCQLPDIIEHLFINWEYSEILWTEVQKWINSIGFSNYKIDN